MRYVNIERDAMIDIASFSNLTLLITVYAAGFKEQQHKRHESAINIAA